MKYGIKNKSQPNSRGLYKYESSDCDEWNEEIISRAFWQNFYDFPKLSPFNIVDDKLRVQPWVFDFSIFSRKFAANVAITTL